MPLDLTSPADSDLISLGAGEIRSLKSDIQDYLSDQQRRRPVLVWVSATTIDVENNTGTEHQTTIAFPDGEVLSVTENTGSANKYRRFIITSTAEFTSGTEDSGLRSGLSEAANTWYAIYAVKSTIDATKFVLAGDTTVPTQANYSTLNTRYGTNGWVFLGYIRNGNGTSSHSDILDFVQCGKKFMFKNTLLASETSVNADAVTGLLLATSASATNISWAYAAGTGAAEVPGTIKTIEWATLNSAHTSYQVAKDSGNLRNYIRAIGSGNPGDLFKASIPASEGIYVTTVVGSTEAFDAIMVGWEDIAVGK